MKNLVLLAILCLPIVSACGLSPEAIASQTATAQTAIAASWTKTPTPTLTPTFTPTNTATATFTATPTPTPLGGGNGTLLFFRDSALYSLDVASQTIEIIITKQQLMGVLRMKRTYRTGILGNISPDGKKAIIYACGDDSCKGSAYKMALLTLDLSIVKPLNFGDRDHAIQWSADSKKVLLQILPGGAVISGYRTYIIGSDEATFGNQANIGFAFSAALSPDGKQVYFSTRQGFKVANSDGTDKQKLDCAACFCDDCNPPQELISYSIAIAPDGQKVIWTNTRDKLFLANIEFTNARELDLRSDLWSAELEWSPDSKSFFVKKYLALSVFVLDGETLIRLNNPDQTQGVWGCGWSPDSRLVSYIGSYSFDHFRISNFIQDINGGGPVGLPPFNGGVEGCPTWLP